LSSTGSAAAQPPFLHDDAAFLLDFRRVERHGVRPVLKDEHRLVEHVRTVGRNRQHVLRVVEARLRVDVRTELHADRLQEGDDGHLRIVRRAVEGHVLDEVREPALVLVFEHRSGGDDEPQLRALLGFRVGADVIPQPVGERRPDDRGIDGYRLAQRERFRARIGNRRAAGRLRAAGTAERTHEDGDRQHARGTSQGGHARDYPPV
jgi:hypothetical protein